VVVNTFDPRGLGATPGVRSFDATPAKSAMGDVNPNFGKGDPGADAGIAVGLGGAEDHLALSTVSKYTGGMAIYNTNDFDKGLDKILARGNGYYSLAFRPADGLDNKTHKLEIKVKRNGVKVYSHTRYLARPDTRTTPRTKEESIANAARSPLARNDIDVTPNVALRFNLGKEANVDIHILIDARKLNLAEVNGHYKDTLDLVVFVFDQAGRNRGGYSDTLTIDLNKEQYDKAMQEGLVYDTGTTVQPDYYQIRVVVREESTSAVGHSRKYVEG
jgi:hypothetical protein